MMSVLEEQVWKKIEGPRVGISAPGRYELSDIKLEVVRWKNNAIVGRIGRNVQNNKSADMRAQPQRRLQPMNNKA